MNLFQIFQTKTLYETSMGTWHFIFTIFIYIQISISCLISFMIVVFFGRPRSGEVQYDNFSTTPPPESSQNIESNISVGNEESTVESRPRNLSRRNFHISSERNRKLQSINTELQSLINILGENNTDPTIVNAAKVISNPHSDKKDIVVVLHQINGNSISPNIRTLIQEYLTERH